MVASEYGALLFVVLGSRVVDRVMPPDGEAVGRSRLNVWRVLGEQVEQRGQVTETVIVALWLAVAGDQIVEDLRGLRSRKASGVFSPLAFKLLQ